TGSVSQPDRKGKPLAVNGTHTYKVAGTFTVYVLILDDDGLPALALSTATVSASGSRGPGGGAQAPGKRPTDAQPLGTDPLLGLNGTQRWVGQDLHLDAILPGFTPEGVALLATASRSGQSGRSSLRDDTYWQLLDQQGANRITDPNGWAANELVLAVD